MGCTGREGGTERARLGVGKWARTLNASFSPSEMEIGADRGTNTFRAGRPLSVERGCETRQGKTKEASRRAAYSNRKRQCNGPS